MVIKSVAYLKLIWLIIDLAVPRSKMSIYGPRSLAVSGPTSWNSLPESFRDATPTLVQFQRRLKTSLFRLAYGRDLTARSFLRCYSGALCTNGTKLK